MTCVVYAERTTCPALLSVTQAVSAWSGATGAVGAAAVCPHVPPVSAWAPAPGGGYRKTLDHCGHTVTVHTPEDHRGCS